MRVTLIKHWDRIELIADEKQLPLEVPVNLYTLDEIAKRMGYQPEETLQLQSIAAEEEDWGAELEALAKQ